MKIQISVPFNNPVTMNWALQLACLQMPHERIYSARKDARVDFARNILAKKAVEGGVDWLFFLDSDTLPPLSTIPKLLETADKTGAKIVSGITYTKTLPSKPTVMTQASGKWECITKLPEEEAFEAEAVGMACCLIHTDVFRKVPEPWFSFTKDDSEDEYFCKKARENGFKVMIDKRIKCLHIGEYAYGERDSAVI